VKGESSSVADLLRPVFDTYRDSAVAVVGCHSTGIARESCELDALVVTDEHLRPTSLRLGRSFCDLNFITEKDALNPPDPEAGVSLALSKVVRDSGLTLSTSVAANQAVIGESSGRASQGRLAACLKALSRTDEALLQGERRDASFWVLVASYEFARSWLYSLEVMPSPSHLLGQLKDHSKGSGKDFEAFTMGAGLEIASRKECGDRLEGLSLLYDLLGSRHAGAGTQPAFDGVAFQIVRAKSEQLLALREHAENYSFLGGEVARVMIEVKGSFGPSRGGRRQNQDVLSSLSDERAGLLSGRLVRELGLERPASEVELAVDALKERAAKHARRI